jgi:hypothetical protein
LFPYSFCLHENAINGAKPYDLRKDESYFPMAVIYIAPTLNIVIIKLSTWHAFPDCDFKFNTQLSIYAIAVELGKDVD